MTRLKGARARADNVPVSTKQAIEICRFLRGRDVEKATQILERVMKKEQAIPFRRFTNALGHKPGMAAGRYPQKASQEILKIISNAKANASANGMTGSLVIEHIAANRAHQPLRNRAKQRVEAKRTHIELTLVEREVKKSSAEKPSAKETAAKKAEPAKKKPVNKESITKESAPDKETVVKKETKAEPATKEEPKKELKSSNPNVDALEYFIHGIANKEDKESIRKHMFNYESAEAQNELDPEVLDLFLSIHTEDESKLTDQAKQLLAEYQEKKK